MENEPQIPTYLSKGVEDLISTIKILIRLCDAVIAVLREHESINDLRIETTEIPDAIKHVLPLMILGMTSSSGTLIRFSDDIGLHTRDCYPIMRSIVETSVNICYILAEGKEVALKAIRHSRQKALRDLKRELRIGDTYIKLFISSLDSKENFEKFEQATAEFTTKKGREKNWTDLSIDERISICGDKFDNKVLSSLYFSRFLIYRHSSEIIHGSFFGIMYFMGLALPSKEKPKLESTLESFYQQYLMILFTNIMSLYAVIHSFHLCYSFSWAENELVKINKSLKSIEIFNRED